MTGKKLQGYISTLFAVFGVLTAAAGLTQVSPRLAVAILVVSGLFGVASAVFFFRARNHSGLGALVGLADPEYGTRMAIEQDLKTIAWIDQETYGSDSVDHEGLSKWWHRYKKGVTVLLEDTEIIGAVGIWPVTKEAYENLTAGKIDERGLDEGKVCDEGDAAPRAYWYFGDIILLDRYQNSMRNFSGRLLMAAVQDWVEKGNLADELHLCAVAIRPRPSWLEKVPVLRRVVGAVERAFGWRASSLGKGEKTLRRLGFKEVGLSPSGQPIFTRSLTKQQLLEDFDRRIKRRVLASLDRAERRSAAAPPAPEPPAAPAQTERRWQWVPFTTAAVLLFAVILFKALVPYLAPATHMTTTYLDSPPQPADLARQTADVLKIGLYDHAHCALGEWDEQAAGERQMAEAMGKKFAPLVGVVRERLTGTYEVAAAHLCAAKERQFVHLILRRPDTLVSVVVTEKGSDDFPQQGAATERVVSGVALYGAKIKTLEVAGFVAQDYLVFIVSNLDHEGNMRLASNLALSVQKYLARL